MDRSLIVCACIIAGIFVLSVLSRTVSSESRLGTYSTATVRRTAERMRREALHLRAASLQDELPAIALGHNAEALAKARCAIVLLQEHGVAVQEEMLDLHADLKEEQEASVQLVAAEIGLSAPRG